MRTAGTVISILLILMGALWTLQGIGLVGGSFMTGDPTWLYIGLATVAFGAIGLALVRRR
jgi:hypothetical protein